MILNIIIDDSVSKVCDGCRGDWEGDLPGGYKMERDDPEGPVYIELFCTAECAERHGGHGVYGPNASRVVRCSRPNHSPG